jgi:hypothetical protein
VITIEPLGGLGNRMRVVDAACTLHERTGRAVQVVWVRNAALHCRFDALFQPLAEVRVVERGRVVNAALRELRTRAGLHDRVLRQRDVESLLPPGSDFSELCRLRSPLLMTVSRFCTAANPLQRFRPVARLERRIADLGRLFTPHTVGLHLRRGDHVFQARSPSEAFLRAMADELRSEPRTTFFVATDAPEDEERLRRAFGDRVLSQAGKALDRRRPEAIEAAVVDLYGLARTRKVIGSFWSSFSEAASAIGRIPLEVIDTGCANPLEAAVGARAR